jgi:GDPmannose 4,6-dehydratase
LGITIEFTGTGVDEIGIVSNIESESRRMTPSCKVGDVVIRVDPRYFRPTEVQTLLGDASRARERLGWSPRTSFEALVQEMAESDYLAARRDALVTLAGFKAFNHHE